jgi:hypothetical protein
MGDGMVIKVKMGEFGYLTNIALVITLILALLSLLDYQTFLGDNINYAILLSLVLVFVFSFVEVGRAKRKAEEMVLDPKKRIGT